MTGYLLGIDNGSQSTKVGVFDDRGKLHGWGRKALRPNENPRPGVVEHPDDDLWDSIGAATRAALTGFAGDPAEIQAVGLCTIRFCRAMLCADGTLASPVLSWMDERLSRPYEHTDPRVRYVTTSSGYLTARLTGRFRDTAANYQGNWPIDTGSWCWAPDQEEIPARMLFELALPGTVLGTVTEEAAAHTGLRAGTPVVATANDKAVEALGCGLRGADAVLLSLGTYIAAMTTGTRDIREADGFWTNFAAVPHEYLYESHGIRRGMWTVSWLRGLLGMDEGRLNAGAAEVPPGSDGLMTVLDWLAPAGQPYRRGAFLGFDGRQGPFHLYRSVLEGIALTMRGNIEAMATGLGTGFSRLLVSGGGADSAVLTGILADVFGIPVIRQDTASAAGLGAAMCAGVGIGAFTDFAEAQRAMAAPRQEFTPDSGRHEFYRRQHEVYREITAHTDPFFQRCVELG
ncbi:FGGY-family carbohydrate kinase [Sciscionella marina]|uniref:FGGY-family carbohydrate kinase n=1 Tax=Sciscionella marina TaxID=508770 RepID=UPI000372893F|nr:FGGY-family carbohydrate kinase [Sciscionella marina]